MQLLSTSRQFSNTSQITTSKYSKLEFDFTNCIRMSQINPQYVLSAIARDKLVSRKLLLQYPNDLDMDHIQTLPFPQLYPNNSFDIIPVQFNSAEFVIYLGFYEDMANFLYMQLLMVGTKYPDKESLLLSCKEWVKKCMEDNSISKTSILPNRKVEKWMIKKIGLREAVIKDINWLWIEAKKNPIMMQNYLDTQEEKIQYEDLTLKDYVMEIMNQRLEKLEIFDKNVQTHMVEEITGEVIKKKSVESTKKNLEEEDEETNEETTQKMKGYKKANHYKKKKSKGRKR